MTKKKEVSKKKATGEKQAPKMTSREKILKHCEVVEKRGQRGNVLIFGKHEYRMNKLLKDLTDAECDRVFKNMKETMGLDVHIKQDKKKKNATNRRKAVTSVDPKPCECGCGVITRRGSRFLPGHDMKLKSKLRKANTPTAKKELAARGWA